jgi:hypothetical protein
MLNIDEIKLCKQINTYYYLSCPIIKNYICSTATIKIKGLYSLYCVKKFN